MLKFIKVLVLLTVIALLGAVIYIKLGSIGPDSNYFNTHYRLKVDRYPFLRKLFGLHYDGDGRSDYLGKQYQKIIVEVDAVQGVNIDFNVLQRFVQKVQEVTGKQTDYLVSDDQLPYSQPDSKQLAGIVANYRNVIAGSDTVTFYVLFLDADPASSTLLGSTYQEYGMLIYQKALENFTKDAPATLQNYEYSTLLHEFGHQLGLDHNEQNGCLMNAKADQSDRAQFDPGAVVTDFCPFEQSEIARQKLAAQ